ncbi:dTDP-4-dehydrorhamnose 3,5-epimerase family protein [Campylobacter jejuni]|uniref:dTDP-4-dehydrorhamnose 3,5-epimerase n=1 Tax=Campylobacter jejuni TaxID=197 RepID=A0A431GBE3_CAMJU|nr:dTDP-4-dehydrorhamnose 3,5-epimerase family protein [Campylobacter jejuni]ECL9136697.1 dTDP-4-dehydrorhamnose 3,5-epimerase [Campylobacter jejuni]RTJ61639.1 dTDP-4-dehydrorhamnose 3,5-epimerase [Campylobacter jejuni]RTJ95717.1 dTDP-4-dehydrorhamnose 3,5-epimerase [Campylobacter jejuni]RTK05895.1 dTDP-4-dehydrorhamnose 3,5-epimerase [Campylobacter jejuni]HDZ4273783.1 dTDP-4-dehydrorhamnose 3,5-epimerase family protein [Campylobacter jejuni]
MFKFDIRESNVLKGVYIVTPDKFKDLRGEIWTAFTEDDLGNIIPDNVKFKHDKFINSHFNVLRGIHGDIKTWKLVTCVYGEVHQVVVDCRKDSPTYLKWEKFIINKDNQQMILLPPNMGNSHYVSSKNAVYYYKLAYDGEYLDAQDQFTYAWNDARIAIDWPTDNPILSERDILVSKKLH